MGIFDPKVDTEVTYQEPVSTPGIPQDSGPSVGLAVAETAANILESLGGRSGGRGGQGGNKQEDFALAQFQNDIMKADAIRSYDPQGAERLERTAALNLQRNGGDLDANAKNTYSAITGRPGDELFFNREQLMEQRIMETPEYESAIIATYASDEDMSQEERHQLALGRVARQQGQSQVLMDQNISWTEGKRDAFSSVISDFETGALGTLNAAAREGQIVPIDQIRSAEAQWSQVRSGLVRMRPEGVNDKQWSQIEDQITQVDAQFEVLDKFSSEEGIQSRLGADLARAIYNNPDWTTGKKVIALDLANDVVKSGAMGSSEIMDMMDSLISIDTDVPVDDGTDVPVDETTGEPSGPPIPENLKTEIDRGDAENAFNKVRNTGRLLTRADPNKAAADPKYRDDFLSATTMSLSYLYKVGDSSRYMTGASLDEALGKNFFTALQKAGETEPAKGRAVANIGVQALQKQQALVTGKIMSNLSGSAMRLDENMNIVLNTDVLEDKVPGRIISALQSGADEYYNGNLIRLFEDNGRRIPQSEEIMPYTQGIVGDTSLLRDQLDSQRAIDRNLQKMKGVRDSFLTNDDNFEGGQGNDTLGAGANRLLAIMDREESSGGADQYGTLFGFSNREGNRFSDVSITDMTLGELSDFSQGEYADWSKGQLGYVATPMGRYQIVGSTLRQTMKEMGLPQNMKFTPEVQDAMFHHLATKSLEGKDTPAAKRAAMRGTWEGFKNVSNKELDAAIAEFEGTTPPSYTDLQNSTNMQSAPRSSSRPQTSVDLNTQNEPLEPTDVDMPSGGGSVSGGEGGELPQTTTGSPEQGEGAGGASQGAREARQSSEEGRDTGRALSEQQRNKATRILRRLGVDEASVTTFESVQDAQQAVDNGDLKPGDVYIVDGEIEVVEEA